MHEEGVKIMIKVVMVDLDGTLLTTEKKITERTVSAIKEFQDKGGLFVVNTGRGYATASKIVKAAGISCDYICLSGAGIYTDLGECIKCDCMTKEEIFIVREVEKKYGLGVNYLTSEGACSESSREWAEAYYLQEAGNGLESPEIVGNKEKILSRYQGILNYVKYNSDIEQLIERKVPVYKMIVMGMEWETFQKARNEFIATSRFKVALSSMYSMELNSARVDKGMAAVDYIRSKGYKMEEVMAIGDSENDYAMLSLPFGKTVAVENAETEIKNICTNITFSNDEDGVAYAIETWGMV